MAVQLFDCHALSGTTDVDPGLYLLLALRSAFISLTFHRRRYMVIIVILSVIGWAGTARIIVV